MSIKSVNLKFSSGNSTPIERVTITREEWDAVQQVIESQTKALENVRAIISEGAVEGFNPLVGDWAERLYYSQQMTSGALRKIK